jgi:hypothetical protein
MADCLRLRNRRLRQVLSFSLPLSQYLNLLARLSLVLCGLLPPRQFRSPRLFRQFQRLRPAIVSVLRGITFPDLLARAAATDEVSAAPCRPMSLRHREAVVRQRNGWELRVRLAPASSVFFQMRLLMGHARRCVLSISRIWRDSPSNESSWVWLTISVPMGEPLTKASRGNRGGHWPDPRASPARLWLACSIVILRKTSLLLINSSY